MTISLDDLGPNLGRAVKITKINILGRTWVEIETFFWQQDLCLGSIQKGSWVGQNPMGSGRARLGSI